MTDDNGTNNNHKWHQINLMLWGLFFLFLLYLGINLLPESVREITKNIITGLIGADILSLIVAVPRALNASKKMIMKNLKEYVQGMKNEIMLEISGLRDLDVKKIDEVKSEIIHEEKNIEDISIKIEKIKENIIEEIDKAKHLMSSDTIEIAQLYTLFGLKGVRYGTTTFQDFDVNRIDSNLNAVSYLWADTYKENKINAVVMPSKDGALPFLRIDFDNNKDSWGCNIAIRPQNEQVLDNTLPQRRYLVFDARIPRDVSQNEDEGENFLEEIAIAVRVVNGNMQHWAYAPHIREYKQFRLTIDKNWSTFGLDLLDKHQWSLFDSDGNINRGSQEANFDIIACVVLKFGRYTGMGEPGSGKGVIDIRSLRLSDQLPLSSNY
jgi:hypothetical protein